MASILVRCSDGDRERIKAKAEAARLSLSAYLLRKGLGDGRTRDSEDSATLANLYGELVHLNQNLKSLPSAEFQRQAIELCEQVGREVVLFRLAQRVREKNQ